MRVSEFIYETEKKLTKPTCFVKYGSGEFVDSLKYEDGAIYIYTTDNDYTKKDDKQE